MRRVAALLVLIPLAVLQSAVPGHGQEEDTDVRLSLLAQRTVVSPDRPFRIRVQATNDSPDRLRNLAMRLWVYPAARSRSELDQALEFDALSPLRVTAFDVRGPLEPGSARILPRIETSLRVLGDLEENALYPVKVELTSEDIPVASLRTAVVFVQERPLVPLNVSVSVVLDEPVRFRPDGSLVDDGLERALLPGGELDAAGRALSDHAFPLTVVVSPILLEEIRRMGAGYRIVGEGEDERIVDEGSPAAAAARGFLERLRSVARRPATEVVALPYASTSVPAMVGAGLEEDLRVQLDQGRDTVSEILGVQPSSSVFYPPGSALSPEAVRVLAGMDVGELLVDAGTLTPVEGLSLTPPALADIRFRGGETLRAIAPDQGVAARMATPHDDPRLHAHHALAELAAIYFERPSVPRGAALVLDAEGLASPPLVQTLFRGLVDGPSTTRWLSPVTANRLLVSEEEAVEGRRLAGQRPAGFSETFLAARGAAREAIDQLASVVQEPTELLDRLRRLVLVAESRHFLGPEDQGLAFLETVRVAVDRELAKVEPPSASSITLTSQGGVIPVTLRNLSGYDMTVRVILRHPRLEFVDGASQEVTLSRPVQAFEFPVRAQSTGRFPVLVQVETPTGHPIGSTRIVVRSTAYNRVALFVTIGAALFLALWWSRRFLPRATG